MIPRSWADRTSEDFPKSALEAQFVLTKADSGSTPGIFVLGYALLPFLPRASNAKRTRVVARSRTRSALRGGGEGQKDLATGRHADMAIYELLKPRPDLRVLVTGGGAGIGAAIADAFVEVGAKVFVCDIDEQAVAQTLERRTGIQAAVADVACRDDADRIVAAAVDALGGLDILISNAGVAGPTGPVEEVDPKQWDDTVAINLNSQFYFLRGAVPHLKRSPSASIVTMSSVAGRLGYPYRAPYAATKWAIVGLMKTLAIELGPSNVRVNAVLPGVVAGPRMDRVIEARAQAQGISVADMTEAYLSKISLRRMVTMDDIAALVLFLCSPAAANITGQAISIDGNVEYL